MIFPVTREEGDRDPGVGSYPRRVARGAMRGDEEPRLLLLQLEGIAEGGASDDRNELGAH